MGLNASEIVSVAGLRVMPDLSLGGFVKDSAAILILPGGNFWTQGELPEVVTGGARGDCRESSGGHDLRRNAGTRALRPARRPLHTSNGREFMGQFVKSYRGAEFYRPSFRPCETGGPLRQMAWRRSLSRGNLSGTRSGAGRRYRDL